MSKSTTTKRYRDMSLEELREATKEFDAEQTGTPGKPLSSDLKARNAKAVKAAKAVARKRGRPPVGQGAKEVLVSMERGLLAEADEYARKHSMNRSELVAVGLRLAMSTDAGVTGKPTGGRAAVSRRHSDRKSA
jgi:hypothetical protein